MIVLAVCHVRTVKTPAKTGFVCAQRRMESRASAFDGAKVRAYQRYRMVPHGMAPTGCTYSCAKHMWCWMSTFGFQNLDRFSWEGCADIGMLVKEGFLCSSHMGHIGCNERAVWVSRILACFLPLERCLPVCATLVVSACFNCPGLF